MPFAGKMGWTAFSNHVPVDGNILIMFAPHVGIDKNGEVGKVNRKGQVQCSTACGAAIGAYNLVKENLEAADINLSMYD